MSIPAKCSRCSGPTARGSRRPWRSSKVTGNARRAMSASWGSTRVHGDRVYKQRIGVVLQDTSVERFLTVAEVIDRFRSFFPSPRPRDEIIEVVGLGEQRDMRVSRLSGGQQRRLDVAIGLAGDPELLFLDEPTTGFDPAARRGAWEMVRNLQSLGKTIFLTTHYMDEAEHLAGRVAVIVDGRIVAEGAPDVLAAGTGRTATITFRLPVETALPTASVGPVRARWGNVARRHRAADGTAPAHHRVGNGPRHRARSVGSDAAKVGGGIPGAGRTRRGDPRGGDLGSRAGDARRRRTAP